MADKIFRVLGNTVKKLVDRGGGTHAERVEAYHPAKLMTDGDGERAVGPGTYYYVVKNIGNLTATVIFNGYWEERV